MTHNEYNKKEDDNNIIKYIYQKNIYSIFINIIIIIIDIEFKNNNIKNILII